MSLRGKWAPSIDGEDLELTAGKNVKMFSKHLVELR
jgi:hypothetical protein